MSDHEHEFKARTNDFMVAPKGLLARTVIMMCACGESEGESIAVPTPFGKAEFAAGRWLI